ncbi:MAG TPA: RAMP superfamily CRISPR-associated protein [Syntrophorhabdaceae bacterium]|nr:RAMP superfamily CRISPR-associated protein [Syntrophorhabdaceae bacterium]
MIKGRLVLEGVVRLKSAALIGSGVRESTDIDILKDSKGRPYIPATSFVGVLRSTINYSDLDIFWGYTSDDNSAQSALSCDDLTLLDDTSPTIEVRDGIKIDPKTGKVAEGAKYDYEVIPPGTAFKMHLEATYRADDKEQLARLLKTIESNLKKKAIRIGAKTNSGLGRIVLEKSKLCDFDYSEKQNVLRWFKRDFENQPEYSGVEPRDLYDRSFSIDMTLVLKSSLIVRSYPSSPDAPDAVHMKSGDDHIIPGTSLKGAIRARALRIIKTLGKSEDILDELFGYVYDDEREAQQRGRKKGDARKGRIRIDEITLPRFVSELQTRIKIDRFTGGTIEAALFETKPLFSSADNEEIKNVRISIRDCRDHEAGLMLLVFKDLWTGDLAVGGEKNIGRGVFKGISAEIRVNGKTIAIDHDLRKIRPEDLEEIERLVSSLVDYTGGAR